MHLSTARAFIVEDTMTRARLAGVPVGDDFPVVAIGVINVAPETFYKGSLCVAPQNVAERAKELVGEGASIIDIGAMSTAPGAGPISVAEEKRRMLPAVEAAREAIGAPISVDTQVAEIAEAAIEYGARIINDVSGFKTDPRMAQVVSEAGCSAILMAADKRPGDARSIEEVVRALKGSLEICESAGISSKTVAIDPGIGFGKELEWDLHILANIRKLLGLNRPICVGVSRKSFIGEISGLRDPADRLGGSLAATAIAVLNGASVVRTHDPRETLRAVWVAEAIRRAEASG